MRSRARHPCRAAAATLFLLSACQACRTSAAAQQPPARHPATVALFPVALYNAQANLPEPTDSAKAALATEVLRARLAELLGDRLLDSLAVRKASGAAEAVAAAGGRPCNVVLACARAAGRTAGARWVVTAKVSKTSNLIWLLTGQLIDTDADTGAASMILDDSTELKGEPEVMVRAGARIFAERVARAVRADGKITNFPTAP